MGEPALHLPVYTASDREAIARRDADIERLQEALRTVREGLRNDLGRGRLLALIAKALYDPDATKLTTGQRRRLQRAELCGKETFLTRAHAEASVAEMQRIYGPDNVQYPYRCPGCGLYHRTSTPQDDNEEGT